MKESRMRKYGLIGYPLSHSFSPSYFAKKFDSQDIHDARYDLYPLEDISEVQTMLDGSMDGFNVTIPYKQAIIEYLDDISPEAKGIGAVNTVLIQNSKCIGHNTDAYGFEESLTAFLDGSRPEYALVLGTGGSSKAICYVLTKLGIQYQLVSRSKPQLRYEELTEEIIKSHRLIVNTTPLGMAPNVEIAPDIPFQYLGSEHFIFDLVYNPAKTEFLKRGELQGCRIKNGYRMLELQADRAWEIWNKKELDMVKYEQIDFDNTEIAFAGKTDKQLKKAQRLFRLMNSRSLVSMGSSLGLVALKFNLPFAKSAVKSTIFEHFCGGENLLDCQNTIDQLYKNKVLTVLDYGAESKTGFEELEGVKEEAIRAVEFAASNNSVPVSVLKMTALSDNELLEKVQSDSPLSAAETKNYEQLIQRLDEICNRANTLGVAVFIDAEESWMQDAIDDLAVMMMAKYNKGKVVVYNTFQMYRHDRLEYLKNSFEKATKEDYWLGAKVVRGAYMDKERLRAEEKNYPSPIQPDKESTDRDYNEAIRFCVENYERIASCCATHNVVSSQLQAQLISEMNINKSHPHLNFCQLQGMSDYITFNLSKAGYNAAKYVVYGPLKEVVPYLIRRAQENTAVTGEMSRELKLITSEVKRRGL